MPWAGLVLSTMWWGCVAIACITILDISRVGAQPPITLAAGGLLAVLPGLLILMASFMARESARSAAAQTLVLKAASQLLDPADANAARAETLATRMTAVSQDVDHAFSGALAAMKALTSEIGDERLRLESVSYAAADNARDLAATLASERTAIESLIRDIRAQGETMNDAIPRQAALMTDMAKQAGEEIARADSALDSRLDNMRNTTGALTDALQKLEGLAASANGQSETVLFAIARIEEKLDQSRRTIETAVRASDAAIQAARRSTPARVPRSEERASAPIDDRIAVQSATVEPAAAPVSAPNDDELFETVSSRPEPAVILPVVANGASVMDEPNPSLREPIPPPFDPFDDSDESIIDDVSEPLPNAISTPTPPPQGDAAWTSILTDLDRTEAGELSREDTAELVIRRLENSGIPLANTFRPKDKKRIAGAARKGDAARQSAILTAARAEVDRVAKRLKADHDLAKLATDFVAMEAPDAIAALDRTQKSSRNASPRLSAFLLLDAATRP